jgi:hypothetical protein
MQNTNATIMPFAFVRDIFSAMSGTNVDFDDADFDALPRAGHVSASFVVSHNSSDVAQAVNSAWPYPAGAQNVDALVVVRGNDMDMVRYKALQGELRRRMHETSTLLISFSPSGTLPTGTISIILLAISHNQTKSQPYLKLVQDEAQHDSE